jgi:hypothetical protein
MNGTCCCFSDCHVLVTPPLTQTEPIAKCIISFSFFDYEHQLADGSSKAIHCCSSIRLEGTQAEWASDNLKKGDRINIIGAKYHVEEIGDQKRKHYFSGATVSRIKTAEQCEQERAKIREEEVVEHEEVEIPNGNKDKLERNEEKINLPADRNLGKPVSTFIEQAIPIPKPRKKPQF